MLVKSSRFCARRNNYQRRLCRAARAKINEVAGLSTVLREKVIREEKNQADRRREPFSGMRASDRSYDPSSSNFYFYFLELSIFIRAFWRNIRRVRETWRQNLECAN